MEARSWQAEASEAVWSGQGQFGHCSDHVSNSQGQLRVKCLPTVKKSQVQPVSHVRCA